MNLHISNLELALAELRKRLHVLWGQSHHVDPEEWVALRQDVKTYKREAQRRHAHGASRDAEKLLRRVGRYQEEFQRLRVLQAAKVAQMLNLAPTFTLIGELRGDIAWPAFTLATTPHDDWIELDSEPVTFTVNYKLEPES